MSNENDPIISVHQAAKQSKYTYVNFGAIRIYGRKVDLLPQATTKPKDSGVYFNCSNGLYKGTISDLKKYDVPTKNWVSADHRTSVLWPDPWLIPGGDVDLADYHWVKVNQKKIKLNAKPVAACVWTDPVTHKKWLKVLLESANINDPPVYRCQSLAKKSIFIESIPPAPYSTFGPADYNNVSFNQSGTQALWMHVVRGLGRGSPYSHIGLVNCPTNVAPTFAELDPTPLIGWYSQEDETRSGSGDTLSDELVTKVLTIYFVGYKGDSFAFVYKKLDGTSGWSVTLTANPGGIGTIDESSHSSFQTDLVHMVVGGQTVHLGLNSVSSSNSGNLFTSVGVPVTRQHRVDNGVGHTPRYTYLDVTTTEYYLQSWAEYPTGSSTTIESYIPQYADLQNDLVVVVHRTSTSGGGTPRRVMGLPTPPSYISYGDPHNYNGSNFDVYAKHVDAHGKVDQFFRAGIVWDSPTWDYAPYGKYGTNTAGWSTEFYYTGDAATDSGSTDDCVAITAWYKGTPIDVDRVACAPYSTVTAGGGGTNLIEAGVVGLNPGSVEQPRIYGYPLDQEEHSGGPGHFSSSYPTGIANDQDPTTGSYRVRGVCTVPNKQFFLAVTGSAGGVSLVIPPLPNPPPSTPPPNYAYKGFHLTWV